MTRRLVPIALVVAACGLARADELKLVNGNQYVGIISRSAPGKITIVTKTAKLTFDDDKVNLKFCTYTEPANYDDVMELLKRKQYAKALPLLHSWEKRYRNLPATYYEEALHGMALCLDNAGKTAEAKALYEKLKDLQVFPEPRYRADAESWLIENEINRASGPDIEKKLRALLASRRSSETVRARVFSLLGKYFEKEGDLKQALDYYATIIVLYGDIEEFQRIAQFKCAELFGRYGRTNEAKFYASQMLETYGTSLTSEEKALCDHWASMKVAAEQPAEQTATNTTATVKIEARQPDTATGSSEPSAPAGDAAAPSDSETNTPAEDAAPAENATGEPSSDNAGGESSGS